MTAIRILFFSILWFTLPSCAPQRSTIEPILADRFILAQSHIPARELMEAEEQSNSYQTIKLHFATDRSKTGQTAPAQYFGANRSDVTYGICHVSIPMRHTIGELESPSWWKLEISENPQKHVVLMQLDIQQNDVFWNTVKERIGQSSTKTSLLFVHGYRVTFEDAARRTAQITYDLNFQGVPMFFSWPSQGTYGGYPIDAQNNEWSQENLKKFLQDYMEHVQNRDVYLIAHSMGSRSLTHAVIELIKNEPSYASRLKEVILAAPDIDAGIFKRDIAPLFSALNGRVTLYASSKDTALNMSKKFNGNPRAGDSIAGPVIAHGIDTVDASKVDTDFMGHSYYSKDRSVLSDIHYLIHWGLRVHERYGLSPVTNPDGKYWEFRR